jgi:uncharacterized protein YkwD
MAAAGVLARASARPAAPAVATAVSSVPSTSPTPTTHAAPRRNPAKDARAFVALINEIRSAHGLRPLAIRKDLTAVATRWSARMAARKKIAHNPDFRYQVRGWWLLGENVGWTNSSVGYLHKAFLASPEHRKNILDPRFTTIGVGEAVAPDGRIYVAEDFGRYSALR